MAGGVPLHEALNRQGGAPVRFVAASALPAGEPYERYIFDSGDCPTRQNLHDFFNGLCWLRLPQAKQRLNALQAGQIAAAGVGARARPGARRHHGVRRERRAARSARRALWEALLARDWQRLFVELRPLWREARLLVFGHALLEKLATPRKDITAHVWAACAAGGSTDEVDGWLAAQLTHGAAGRQAVHAAAAAGHPRLVRPKTRTFPSMMTPWYFVPPGARTQRQQRRQPSSRP